MKALEMPSDKVKIDKQYQERTKKIIELYEQGISGTEIGKELGISRQRVYQILNSNDYFYRHPDKPRKLRERQAEVLYEFICEYKTLNDGLSPTISMMIDTTGCGSLDRLNFLVNMLVDQGRIQRRGHQLMVVGGKWTSPTE